MAKCDACGRAVLKVDAVTFPENDIVICRRAECETVANDAKYRYYNDMENKVKEVLP